MTLSGPLLCLSVFFALCLTFPAEYIALAAVFITMFLCIKKIPRKASYFLPKPKLIPLGICLLATARFAGLCLTDPYREAVRQIFGRFYPVAPCGFAMVCGVAAYPAVSIGWDKFSSYWSSHPLQESSVSVKVNRKQCLILLGIAFAAITLLSKNSPLYPFNDWVDIQCFFTMGKAMTEGKVLYRDIYEQKGPLLYMLYALSYIYPRNSFLVIWLLEVAACWCFLYNSYRCILIYFNRNSTIWVMPVFAFVVYSSCFFAHGGSCEEFCLPALSYCCYLGLRLLTSGEKPKWYQSLLIGISSGCVLWIKFNLLGFYIGWIIVPSILLLRNGDWKGLFALIGEIALGVLLVTAPILGYFVYHGALADLFTAYFYNNIFVYRTGSNRSMIFHLIKGVLICTRSWVYFPVLVLGLLSLWCMTKKSRIWEKLHLLLTFGVAFLTIFFSAPTYEYYAFILNVSLFYCFISLATLLPKVSTRLRTAITLVVCIFCILGSPNTYLMLEKKEDLPQYQFAEIIRKVPDATLLNYGFLDGGFYMASDTSPVTRFFCKLHTPLEEMNEELDSCISEGKVDFVVTRNNTLDWADNYHPVAETSHRFEYGVYTYRLFQKNE